MTARPLRELIDDGWATALQPVEEQVAEMGRFLREEVAAGRGYLPAGENVLRAFTFPFDKVRIDKSFIDARPDGDKRRHFVHRGARRL